MTKLGRNLRTSNRQSGAPRLGSDVATGPAVGHWHVSSVCRHRQLDRISSHSIGFGSDVLAGYTIGIRVIIFAILPSWGMSNAAATMVGQALGAGKPERAEKAVWMAGFYNMMFLGIIGLVFVVFAPQIVSVFTSDPEPARYAVMCLRIVSTGFPFYAYAGGPQPGPDAGELRCLAVGDEPRR